MTLRSVFLALAVLAGATSAQALETRLILVGEHDRLELALWSRTATLAVDYGETRRRLDQVEALELEQAARAVGEAADAYTNQPSTLFLETAFQQAPQALDVEHPAVQPLLARLSAIRDQLAARPRKIRGASLRLQVGPHAFQEVRLDRAGRIFLRYRLGDMHYELPSPGKLTARERKRLRRATRVFQREAPQARVGVDTPSSGEPSLRLELRGPEVTFAFVGEEQLPSTALPVRDVLEQILQRTFVYSEETFRGRVIEAGQGIAVGPGVRVETHEASAALVRELEGEWVVVRALVRDDRQSAVALYFVAHDGEGGIVPVRKVERDGWLTSTRNGVVPPRFTHVYRQRALIQRWRPGSLDLVWSAEQLEAVLDQRSPDRGLSGALRSE